MDLGAKVRSFLHQEIIKRNLSVAFDPGAKIRPFLHQLVGGAKEGKKENPTTSGSSGFQPTRPDVRGVEKRVKEGIVPPPPTPPNLITTVGEIKGAQQNTSEVRRLLNSKLEGDYALSNFVSDNFPEIHKRFSSGMSRVEKISLLISGVDTELLKRKLKDLP